MSVQPVDIPIRVDKEAALAAIRETEAAHRASLDRMDGATKASFAKTRAAAAALSTQLRASGGDPLMGSSPGLYASETTKASAATSNLARNVDATNRSMSSMFRDGSRGLRALSAGIGAATAATAGHERSWIGLGTSILSAWGAGGAVTGAIAAGAGVIGLIVGAVKESGEEAEKAKQAQIEWLDQLREGADKAAASARDLARDLAAAQYGRVGIGLDAQQLELLGRGRALEDQVRHRRAMLAPSSDPRADLLGTGVPSREDILRSSVSIAGVSGGPALANERLAAIERERKALAELERQLAGVREQLDALKRLRSNDEDTKAAAAAEERASAVRSATDAVRQEVEVLRQKSALEREIRSATIERDARVTAGVPRGEADAALRLKVEEAIRAETARYAADVADLNRERVQAEEDVAAWIGQALERYDALVDASARHLRDTEALLRIESATEGVERDRVEAEEQIAQWIAAGTLAAGDQAAALKLLLDLSAKRRANAAAGEDDRKRRQEQDEATRKAEAEARARASATEDVERQLRYLEAANDVERQILEIEDRIADLRKQGVPEDLLGRLRSDLVAKVLESSRVESPVVQVLEQLRPTISGGLAEMVLDGFETGFDNLGSIAHSMWRTLLAQLLNDLANSGLQAAIAALGAGFGSGGGSSGVGGIFGGLLSLVGLAGGGGGSGGFSDVGGVGGVIGSIVTGGGVPDGVGDVGAGLCAGGT